MSLQAPSHFQLGLLSSGGLWLCLGLLAATIADASGGYEPCWSNGASYEECCQGRGNPSCFDGLFTKVRCCSPADYDGVCWHVARTGIDSALAAADHDSWMSPTAKEHMQAMRQYRDHEGYLYFFCCASAHNEYCWGRSIPENLLPDPDGWNGLSDITHWHARCCYPRLRKMLQADTPGWMQQQIERDFRALREQRRPWPSREQIEDFRERWPKQRHTLCNFTLLPAGEVRHCNFSAHGNNQKEQHRAQMVARALAILKTQGLLPKVSREVSFLIALTDIERTDSAIPLVTFQRSKSAKFLIRIPMWEHLDASWTRRVEQQVLSHESLQSYQQKQGKRIFWRGTDSNVPTGDCKEGSGEFSTCEVSPRTVRNFSRLLLVFRSLEDPRRVDARISGVKPKSMMVGNQHVYQRLGLLQKPLWDWPLEKQLKKRYLLDVDGSSQSTRLFWTLLSKSLLFKQRSWNCNWYSDALKPFVHYVPVRADFADLAIQAGRLQVRPKLARSIAARGSQWAEKWLSHEDAIHYLARVLKVLVEVAEAEIGT